MNYVFEHNKIYYLIKFTNSNEVIYEIMGTGVSKTKELDFGSVKVDRVSFMRDGTVKIGTKIVPAINNKTLRCTDGEGHYKVKQITKKDNPEYWL